MAATAEGRERSAGLGTTILGAMDALIVCMALLFGLPLMNSVVTMATSFAVAAAAFVLVRLLVGSLLTKSWKRLAMYAGAALTVNVAALMIGSYGFDQLAS